MTSSTSPSSPTMMKLLVLVSCAAAVVLAQDDIFNHTGSNVTVGDFDCLVSGDSYVCPVVTTLETPSVTIESDITCSVDVVSQFGSVEEASQQGGCVCTGVVVTTGEASQQEPSCNCVFCPENSVVGVSYECDDDIIGTCRSLSCSGECNDATGGGNFTDPTDNMTGIPSDAEFVTVDLSSATTENPNITLPLVVYTVLPANDDQYFELHVPEQSQVYMTQIAPPEDPTVEVNQTKRSLQTTAATCPPSEGSLVSTTPTANNTSVAQLDLQGTDTEILVCDNTTAVAHYFVSYQEDIQATNETEPDYQTTFDFMSGDSSNSSSFEAEYGPGAPQNGVGYIVLAGDLIWYESTKNITIGDACPTNETLIPADPSFPFTLYIHPGGDTDEETTSPEVLHGCDANQTQVVGEVFLVFVELSEPPSLAPTPPPVLPPVGFKEDCNNFNITLGDQLEETCTNWCNPGTSEVFDWAAVDEDINPNHVNRYSVCRCCNDNGPCQTEDTLLSKWECWTVRENVWDLSQPVKSCAEMEIGLTECGEFCTSNLDPVAFEYNAIGGSDGKPICKCADAFLICGMEEEEKDGLSTGALIGIIIGALLLCCCCVWLLLLLLRRRRSDEEEDDYPEDADESFIDPEDGDEDEDDEDYEDEEDEEESESEDSAEAEPRLALGYGEEEDDDEESDEEDDSEYDEDESDEEDSDEEFDDEDSD